jgi:hypothetical protein
VSQLEAEERERARVRRREKLFHKSAPLTKFRDNSFEIVSGNNILPHIKKESTPPPSKTCFVYYTQPTFKNNFEKKKLLYTCKYSMSLKHCSN